MKRIAKPAAIALAAVILMAGTATAASRLTARDLATGAANHRVIADGAVHRADLTWRLRGLVRTDSDVLAKGTILRTAHYDNGGSGIATVACGNNEVTSQKYVAISGGARVDVAGAGTNTEPITSSFQGRMDWTTNTPEPGRLDGWIVKFGAGAAPSAAAGDVLEVYAYCVRINPLEIKTQVTHYSSPARRVGH